MKWIAAVAIVVAAQQPPIDLTFSFADRGGLSVTTSGQNVNLATGYARIRPTGVSTTPFGVAILGFRRNNVLVSEAGVPASPLIQNGRVYAEVNGPLNGGFAIANPNNVDARIDFYFTDASGVDFSQGNFTLQANGQNAFFLNQPPINGRATMLGTFSFRSSVPVSAIALRTLLNERNEFLMTTLPVLDTSLPAVTGTQFIPHFAEGGGFTTHILLVNPTDTPLTGTIQFFSQGSETTPGARVNVSVGGQSNSSFAYSVPRRSAFKLSTAGTASALTVGSVRVAPAGGGAAPVPLVVFTYKPASVTLSEAGVPAIQGNVFRMYVESSGVAGLAGSIQSGFALANTSTTSGTVTLELTRMDGSRTGLPDPVSRILPADGQIVGFLPDFFSTLPNPFQGVLRISTTSPAISVVGIRSRYNEVNSFLMTTTPPYTESRPASSADLLFPHIVNGVPSQGTSYTTQFALFSGAAGQSPSGTLGFFKPDGTALSLAMRPRNPLEGAGELTAVTGDYRALEGPQWLPMDGALIFLDNRDDAIYKLSPPNTVTIFRSRAGGLNGLGLDEQGRLLVAGGGRVTRTLADGRIETLADSQRAGRSISPNDLVVRSDGIIYFSALGPVLSIGRDGAITTVWQPAGAGGSNGIALSPNETVLYVGIGTQIQAFDVALNGSLSNERIFAATAGRNDGMTVDRDGNVFVATDPGIQVFSPNGQLWGTIAVPRPSLPETGGWNRVTNCAFAGPDGTTLYITGQKVVYRIELSIPGSYFKGR